MTSSPAEKITGRHHERLAYVYVRQSTAKQVLQNAEGRQNQYALVQRAIDLGWSPERVRVIDCDLGQSGQDGQRPGFQELVTAVSLGRVGLILAYEASRLARNNGDWYTLVDLATVRGALLGDVEGVYDPREYNDRLLLGLRGILSEAELHVLHLRMAAGRRRQIEAGTYRQCLPTGLLRLDDQRVVKDPDLQIQRTIALVFERFEVLHSCQKVMRSLRDDGLLLPRRQRGGLHAGQVLWRKPAYSALSEILHNPAYAGVFAYGRKGPAPDRRPGQPSSIRKPLAEWTTLLPEVYPAYITWEQFMANQAQLADNASDFARRARAAPRQGGALLAGLVVCGCCGYQMHVAYKPHQRYACTALAAAYGASTCLHVEGVMLDAAVVAAFFEALAPAELDLLDEVLAEQRADQARVAQQYADQVARADYEAHLAQRQYQGVDPDNRLVAAELERRWELALHARTEAHEAAESFAARPLIPKLTPEMQATLHDLGRLLPNLWAAGRLTPAHQKALLRSLIRRVIVTRPLPDKLEAKIVWTSGAVSSVTLHPPIQQSVAVASYEQLVQRVLALGAEGYENPEIARRVTAEGFRSARSPRVPASLVSKIRLTSGQSSVAEQFKTQPKIDGQWTVFGLARELAVHRNWLYTRIRNGTLPAVRHPVLGHYLIPDSPEMLTMLRGQRDRCCYR